MAKWLDTVVPAIFPSDAALARAAGVDRSQVARWRQGSTPHVRAMYGLAKATGVSVEYLFWVAGYARYQPPEAPGD